MTHEIDILTLQIYQIILLVQIYQILNLRNFLNHLSKDSEVRKGNQN